MSNNTLDLQYSLLGNYLKKPDLFDPLQHLMREKLFTTTFTRQSYLLIKSYHAQNKVPDIMILYRDLSKAGHKEEADGVSQLNERPLKSKQVEEYVTILFNDYAADYLNEEFKKASTSKDPLESIERAKSAINNVELALNNVSADKSIMDVFDETLKNITDLKNGVIEQSGFKWGINDLDRKTGGINVGVNVVAAMPGAGKTSLMINVIVANSINEQIPMLVFSLEMTAMDLMKNIIANVTEINSRSIREGNIDDGQLLSISDVRSKLRDSLVIDETDGITWQMFETKIKAFRKKYKLPLKQKILVALDYLQKTSNSPDEKRGTSVEERMGITCNEIARVCKHQNVALIEISQFSRETGKRDVPRPKMSDLKGSAAIEQNAILILLMYRPEYHGITSGPNGMDLKGLCEINIAKGRFVNPEPVYAKFEGRYSKFSDYNPEGSIKTSGEESF